MALDKFSSAHGAAEKTSDGTEKVPGEMMRLLVDGKEEVLDSGPFLERYGVTKWVRIPKDEFDANFGAVESGQIIDHFNLKMPNHEVGKKYLFMRIEGGGDASKGIPPLLSLDGAFRVECLDMKHNIQDDLKDEYFEHPLQGIDKESLKSVIKHRYKATDDDIAQKGIAYTRFRVLEKV